MSLILRPSSSFRKSSRSLATAASLNTPAQPETKREAESPAPLHGTVQSHRSYILLHSTKPPSSFPPRITSALHRALQLKASKWGGIVNFSWMEHRQSNLKRTDSETVQNPMADGGRVSATAFSSLGGRMEIPEISLENLDEVEAGLRRHAEGLKVPVVAGSEELQEEIHLYVCTHGARDCRCGTMGGDVVSALRKEVARRLELDPSGLVSRLRVGEVGHVGGHQYAANLLIFPHGEWLGRLKPGDIPDVLSGILKTKPRPQSPSAPPLFPHHWRGRMGLTKEEQVELFTDHASALSLSKD